MCFFCALLACAILSALWNLRKSFADSTRRRLSRPKMEQLINSSNCSICLLLCSVRFDLLLCFEVFFHIDFKKDIAINVSFYHLHLDPFREIHERFFFSGLNFTRSHFCLAIIALIKSSCWLLLKSTFLSSSFCTTCAAEKLSTSRASYIKSQLDCCT